MKEIDKGMGKIIPSMTFCKFSRANKERCIKSFGMCDQWTPGDWVCALVGELGEAANLIKKKYQRGEDISDQDIAHELADTFTYLDLLATRLNINLEKAVREKFNIVSERVGSDIKL